MKKFTGYGRRAFAVGSFAAILSLLAAASANAQINLDTGVGASVNGGASVNASVGTGTGTTGRSSVTGSGSLQTGTGTGVKTGTSGNATSNIGVTSTTGTDRSSTSTNDGNTFVMTRSDVSASSTVAVDPASVTSNTDLSLYARSVLQNDENVTKIEANDTQVSVWYNQPAKFLGFIPVNVSTKATVSVDGTVSVDHPWWYSMFVKDDTGANIQSDLSTTAGTIARASGSVTFSANDKARLVNAIKSVMSANYISATGTTSAEMTTY